MSIGQLLLAEYDTEAASTRKVLERVPSDPEKWNWKPHEKSGTLGWMAAHVASLPSFTILTITTPALEIDGYQSVSPKNQEELVPTFDKLNKEARELLANTSDEKMKENWRLTWKGNLIFDSPRYEVLRTACFNHIVHHRAQLTVYFRLLGVPVPGLYGPSADEM